MKLTTKGRYAVTAVLDLAIHQDKGPVSLAAISERQSISLSYLEQLFSKLRRNGIVNSTRGPGGGYRLKNSAEEITVSDVIVAIDENCEVVSCDDTDSCSKGSYQCLTHDLWQEISNEIRGFLDGISIADVLEGKVDGDIAVGQDVSVTEATETVDNSTAETQEKQDKAVVNL